MGPYHDCAIPGSPLEYPQRNSEKLSEDFDPLQWIKARGLLPFALWDASGTYCVHYVCIFSTPGTNFHQMISYCYLKHSADV